MHVLLLLSLKLVASVLTGSYVLAKVKIVVCTSTYFHVEDGGKGVLAYYAALLVLHSREMSLTCSSA